VTDPSADPAGMVSAVVADLAELEVPDVVLLDGAPSLRGSVCPGCGGRAFPARRVCYRCGRPDPPAGAVGARGRLYSWTTVHASRTRPVPYSLGYVDLAGDLRVLAPLGGDPAGWHCDAPVELVVSGERWWFAPVPRARP
jgi:uncharacterized OB-fold protein